MRLKDLDIKQYALLLIAITILFSVFEPRAYANNITVETATDNATDTNIDTLEVEISTDSNSNSVNEYSHSTSSVDSAPQGVFGSEEVTEIDLDDSNSSIWRHPLVVAVLSVLCGAIIAVLGFAAKSILGKRPARVKLCREAKEAKLLFLREGMFFSEINKPYWEYSQDIPIKCIPNIEDPNSIKGSFLVTGDAGCGKSAFLRNNFIRASRWSLLKRIINNRITYWIDAPKAKQLLDSPQIQDSFLQAIKSAMLDELVLYIDGADEITDWDAFSSFLSILDSAVSVRFCVSARTEFANKKLKTGIFHNKFGHELIMDAWNADRLRKLGNLILNKLNRQNYFGDRPEKVKEFLSSTDMPWEFVQSPLLLKMFLYIKLFSTNKMTNTNNKYQFYTDFFLTILNVYRNRHGRTSFEEVELDTIAKEVFIAYRERQKEIPISGLIDPISKPKINESQNKICLTHETFYEYLTARYYSKQIAQETVSEQSIEVLLVTYSNDYADFITASLLAKGTEEQKKAMINMIKIYGNALPAHIKKLFCTEVIDPGPLARRAKNRLNQVVRDNQSWLTLKYEVIFRMGRFAPGTEEDLRTSFLEFVYDHDNLGEGQEFDEAVLKRGCAVSASFMGRERIELDFFSKMTGINAVKNENYDLANRSHTLVFYGDVPENDIFTFRDTAAQNSWDYSRAKRINRLNQNLPDLVADMNNKQKRLFYFRVFDLATIYTFLESRPNDNLSSEEIQTIRNCQIVFHDASDERGKVLSAIKEGTIELIEQRMS